MCGIFYSTVIPDQKVIDSMFKTLEKRGPDGKGLFKGKDFILGHTRLSIIDTNQRSNQPMEFNDLVVSFNGEIYNYKDLKKTILREYKFKTESDTEVIIALYDLFGTDGWKHLRGMFAFIFYDKKKNQTFFIRDPLGIKPLYYHYNSGNLIVASKISTIQCIIGKDKVYDPRGINEILALGYPRKPIYKTIYEIEPGYVYKKNLTKEKINFIVNKKKTIKDAITEQFVNSDRPVGITLSGGIDSGYIAYVCSKVSKQKIHTFTIGFSEKDEDILNARKVANFIGSIHHEIIVPNLVYDINLKEGIDKLEQPFDLGSVSMTNLLGKEIAKTDVKVILIGEGNDELNGGYKRYAEKSNTRTQELWEWYKKRIIKNDVDARREIIPGEVTNIIFDDLGSPENSNKMLWFDIKNELRFYHLMRIDHIISDFGIEARVPYLDYDYVMNIMEESFVKKVNTRGNKLLLRDFAVKDGYPTEFAFIPKIPLKRKGFEADKHLIKLWKEFVKNGSK
jgi:asparagine synthase (glutamine-hydrolysing)